jgi:molecular chaperone GrpE
VSDLLLHDNLITFGAQPAVEHFMCCQCGGVTWMPHNANTLEMIVHFLEVLVTKISDNVSTSLETLNLIPIIIQVSEMNAKKRGEIHE